MDVDGVLYPFVDRFRDWLVSRGHDRAELGEPTVWSFHREDWGLTTEEWMAEFVAGIEAGVIFGPSPAIEGAVEAMLAITSAGDELHLVTSRNVPTVEATARRSTFAWLGELGVPFDSVTVSHDKGAVETDVFLEDSVDNYEALEAMGETVPVLFTQPYNGDHPGLRVDSHAEFVALLDALRHDLREAPDGAGAGCDRCGGWWTWEHVDLTLTGVCEGEALIVGDAHPYADLWPGRPEGDPEDASDA